jgi:predicted PurR-regulated permease PerM
MPRWVAALIVIVLMVTIIVLMIFLMVPVIGAQLTAFIADLPGYVRKLQVLITDPNRPWLSRFVGDRVAGAEQSAGDLISKGAELGTAFLGKVWSGGAAVLSVFSLLVITPVVAFYFIADWPRITRSLERLVPRPQHDTVMRLTAEIDKAVAGFIRGQTIVCVILGVFYAVALSLVGLNFGLLIGLISGLIGFIPYVGSVTGFVLATSVALVQFWPEWIWIVAVVGIFIFGQFVEGNILVPKLVGDSVGLHPLWLMFALFAFGYLFGFLGLLLAVPLAAAVGVLVRFGVGRYVDSPLYRGGN